MSGCSSPKPPVAEPVKQELSTPQQELLSLIKLSNEQIDVSFYEVSKTAAGKSFAYNLSVFKKFGKTRTDTVYTQLQTRDYFLDGQITTCTKIIGAPWLCKKAQGISSNHLDSFTASPLLFTVTPDGEMNTQSMLAKCYKVVKEGSSGSTRVCYSLTGILVNLETTAVENRMTQMLTSRRGYLSEDDFKLPGPLVE